MREPPRLSPSTPEPLRDRSSGELRELAEPAQAEPLELRVAVGGHGKQRERQRLEERLLVLHRHDQDLTGTRDARCRESRETTSRGADARVPGGADCGERALERRLHAPVESLDAARLEDDSALLGRIDREARVLEPPEHALPLPLDGRRIAVDEDE